MTEPCFTYVTYIRTTPEALWEALTSSAFTERYWSGTRLRTDWTVGSKIDFTSADGAVQDTGEVLEYAPHTRLSYSFKVEWLESLRAEPASRVTFEIEHLGEEVKLTLIHDRFAADSQILPKISQGWPQIVSSLKSLLETDSTLALTSPAAAQAAREKFTRESAGASA